MAAQTQAPFESERSYRGLRMCEQRNLSEIRLL